MSLPALNPGPGDALLVVDVQRDFLPGGALAVPCGNAVLGPLEGAMALFVRRGLPVIATRDWHPRDHCSFAAQGGPWPVHCVAGTPGAEFAPTVTFPTGVEIVSKGVERTPDAYSGFDRTGLGARLRALGVRRVIVGGLATDYCVRATVLDALALGFAVAVLTDAVRAVDVEAGDGERALQEMAERGARLEHAVGETP